MNLKKIYSDLNYRFYSSRLFDAAKRRDKIIDRCSSFGWVIILHLFKCVYIDGRSYSHYRREVARFLWPLLRMVFKLNSKILIDVDWVFEDYTDKKGKFSDLSLVKGLREECLSHKRTVVKDIDDALFLKGLNLFVERLKVVYNEKGKDITKYDIFEVVDEFSKYCKGE